MASNTAAPSAPKGQKRKDSSQSSQQSKRAPKRQKTFTARQILTQTSDPALKSGELDLASFLKAREFEIKALEDGMRRAKGALTKRAFQLVPWEMRRRTASHNVKRVPKRMQKRARTEMRGDNTPTVAGPKKPKTARGRIRSETAKKLRAMAGTKRAAREKARKAGHADAVGRPTRPRTRMGVLARPKPESKFRKRQIHKTWLPTHMFHAKRATMTPPSAPLWRFALPITPQQKCYRPAHRAGGKRGALCWDMSYMSTIGLEGTTEALRRVLAVIGVVQEAKKEAKWLSGKRTWSGWLSRNVDDQRRQVAQGTVIWCPEQDADVSNTKKAPKVPRRKLFIRTHPTAFLDLWEEVLRAAKMQYPVVHVEDLRYEIGGIELTGPDATEALIGVLNQYNEDVKDHGSFFHSLLGVTNAASLPPNSLLSFPILDPRLRHPPQKLWLPDPKDQDVSFQILEDLATWPADNMPLSAALFDREARYKATKLPSQKAINRRKGAADPGEYPTTTPADQPIPVLLYPSQTSKSTTAQGSWTLLAPWKCINAIWYSLVHFPLNSGGNPRFAGLQEWQQIHFERGVPCFPMDYPGTEAGYKWEIQERERRRKEREKKPKGKRIAWESVDLGGGRRGEIGEGWSCNFEKLMPKTASEKAAAPVSSEDVAMADVDIVEETVLREKANDEDVTTQGTTVTGSVSIVEETVFPTKAAETKPAATTTATPSAVEEEPQSSPFVQLTAPDFSNLLTNPSLDIPHSSLATVKITLFSRGVPQPCARIYRLPSSAPPATAPMTISSTEIPAQPNRGDWLKLVPTTKPPAAGRKHSKPAKQAQLPKTATMPERVRALAQELLQNPPLPYPTEKEREHPLVPGEEDLIGFVTTGNFNLAEGAGSGVGSLAVEKLLEGVRRDPAHPWKGSREDRLCVVRNAGEGVGRLGYWEIV